MEGLLHTPALILFAISLTWGLSVLVGRWVTRRRVALWVWNRSGAIGRVLLALGFGLAALGLSQGARRSAARCW